MIVNISAPRITSAPLVSVNIGAPKDNIGARWKVDMGAGLAHVILSSRSEEKVDLLLTPAIGEEDEGPKRDRPVFPNTGRLERLEAFRVAQGWLVYYWVFLGVPRTLQT